MSMHIKPLTPIEEAGLRAHGLPVGKPSQLADAFRLGMAWADKARAEAALAEPQSDAESAMTRADVLRLALEAGFTWEPINNIADPLERFATLVLEADDGPWKAAVIDQLIIAHTLTAEHESDPLKAIQDLLAYHADIAVDPRVSGAAEKLVEQAKAEEREGCAKALDDGWFRCQADAVAAIRARGQK